MGSRKLGSGLIDILEWMRTQGVKDAEQETTGPTREEETPNAKNVAQNVETAAIVTGRPQGKIANAAVEVDLGGRNWVGLLIEYRNANPKDTGPSYKEFSPALNLFTCSVQIGEHISPFGIPGPSFSKKKDAKQYASKLAIEWLISHSYMPADGSISFPKTHPKPGPDAAAAATQSSGGGGGDGGEASPGKKVAELCVALGVVPPTYVITSHEEFPAMYSGFAHFGGMVSNQGRIGEFDKVYGRANAKAECARGVLVFLRGLQKARAEAAQVVMGKSDEGAVGVD